MRIPAPSSTTGSDATGHLDAVTTCPFCRSPRVTTTNKTLTLSTYWRCHACGEIWNPRRVEEAARFRRW